CGSLRRRPRGCRPCRSLAAESAQRLGPGLRLRPQDIECLLDAGLDFLRDRRREHLRADLEVLELGARVAELRQADAALGAHNVIGLDGEVIVDVAANPALLETDLDGVPFAAAVMRALLL